ncbi:Bgt-140 [Blumeria graminis f. sp. tritici]|uniref:Bgt-140 n=2 Tax=Blumeria graminis f. sp. tritici TaxID=62690 RepID=A0A061HBZ2_BLUGR|nr:hypothetical protein BGT96224_140 [Blumeria graminis f. sp. tritici 96224]VDB93686.1 Bgt-140 [Blumeria graminis f. sp. tritici]
MASSATTQKPPAGLAGVLNGPENPRDSAYFSAKDPASKHNSTQSSTHEPQNSINQISRKDITSTAEITTSISTSTHTQINSPPSRAMSVASIVSPTRYGLPQTLHELASHNSGISLTSAFSALGNKDDSRRESVDSRLRANFGDMRLANSPCASANPSTTSLQSTLAQQRNPGTSLPDRNSGSIRLSNGYHHSYQRIPDTPMIVSRTAPLITGPALGAIARASEPTKGQAWAFPEEPVHRIPSSIHQSDETSNRHVNFNYDESRRNSFTDSIASSQHTAESRLPPGQRRLEDGVLSEQNRGEPSEYQVSTHHHSLQYRQFGDLQADGDSQNGAQPYSRTPELRVSHKLAERKRRLEMKDLFDNLRSLQSVERGAKASKWEILSKAISEHERQTKLIEEQKRAMGRLESQLQRMEVDLDNARRESSNYRAENAQLRSEISVLQQSSTNGPYHGSSSQTLGYGITASEQPSQLPPLRSIQGPEVMSGVQYHHDQRSTHAYSSTLDNF